MGLQQKLLQDLSTSVAPACNKPKERWFTYQDGFDAVTYFCDKPNGNLKLRPSPVDDFPDAQLAFTRTTQDPSIRVYAYVDDTCKDKPEVLMNKEDCHRALDSILHECELHTFRVSHSILTITCRRQRYGRQKDGRVGHGQLPMVQHRGNQEPLLSSRTPRAAATGTKAISTKANSFAVFL
jgi:hypothetical protein